MTTMSTKVICRICHTSYNLIETSLRTCEDIRTLGEYKVFYCNTCDNGFTFPDVPMEAYELLPDVSKDEQPSSASAVLQWFIEQRVKKLEFLFGKKKLSLLDIGGGACAFANAMACREHLVTVIEPNEKNKKYADTSNGVNFISKMFSDDLIRQGILKPNSYDVVTMWHSLEHTPDPQKVLIAIRAILKPGGIVFISVPNLTGLQAKMGGNYWTYLDVPHHLCHFTPRGLKLLLVNSGFGIHNSYRFSIEYDPFGWYQTLLNMIGRSHNYFYNSRKKNRADETYLRYPRWTKFTTACGPLLLPIVGILSLISMIVNTPACVEIVAKRES